MSDDLKQIKSKLRQLYTDEEIKVWLIAPQVLLDGKTAAEVLFLDEDPQRIINILDSLLDSTYT